jgi:hypothetical protein
MRHPGDNAAGQTAGPGSGRHRDPARQDAPGRRGQPATRPDAGSPDTGPSVFGPGGRPGAGRSGAGGHAAGPGPAADGTISKGPVRGFPPAPGQPPPLYPPGQFAAWNRLSAARRGPAAGRAGSPADGRPAGARAGDETYEPGYSALAVSDPAADVTSTQTWQAIGDSADGSGTWTSPRGLAPADPGFGAADLGAADFGAAGPAPTGPDADGQWPGGPGPAGPGLVLPEAPGAPAARAPGSRTAARAAARGGSRSGRSAARRPARKGRPVSAIVAVCAVLIVAVAAGVFLLHAAEHPGAPATADRTGGVPSRAAAAPSPTLGQFGHIASRAADPLPLTVAQLYPDAFTAAGVTFSRTTSKPTGTCSSAVIGTALQAAVPASTCSQVVRASYLATAEKAMGTIGVLNLSTAASAAHAGHAASASDFIAQLQGLSGPTRALGQGAGLEEAATKGHYLILIWAQFVNSAAPKSPAQQAQLKAFMTQLFDQTANLSLSNRMVSGTP